MESDTPNADLRASLVPSLAAVNQQTLSEWRSEVFSAELKAELLADRRLENKILNELYALKGLQEPVSTSIIADHPDILSLFDDRVDVAALRSGLIFHADQLAEAVSTSQINITDAKWALEDVRFALRHRDRQMSRTIASIEFVDAVKTSGRQCLSAWLNKLPIRIKRLLELSDSRIVDALDEIVVCDERANIFSFCIGQSRAET